MFDSLLGATNDTTKGKTGGPSHSESVGDEYLNLRAEIDRLEAHAAALLGRVDQERPWRVDGYASTTAWLTHRGRMRRGRARRLVVEARALATMPATHAAFGAGGLSSDQTAELIRARGLASDEFGAYEQTLLDSAQDLECVSDLRTVCDYWHQAVAETPATELAAQRDARYLSVSQTFEGMVKLDGLFDPDTGARLLEKLEASTPPPDGDRTGRQRRADALADLVLGYSTAPTHTVLVHLDHTQRLPHFDFGLTNRGSVLNKDAVERLTCDANVERIVHGPDGRILDHGRTQRTISPAMKRALIARDHQCRFPGCQRPPWWCDGHHVKHWKNGGDTSLDNLILLCRHHHTSVHEHGFSVDGPGHQPTFRRPDRSILEWHPPPPD